jgi:hypothetical protein
MARGKEIKLKTNNEYSVAIGTVDSKTPKSVYLRISTWGQPKIETPMNYNNVINRIHKNIKSKLNQSPDNRFYIKRTIIDLDMRDSGIKYNKRSFMNCELTLFQKEIYPLTSNELQSGLDSITNDIIELLDSNEAFKFYKRKK